MFTNILYKCYNRKKYYIYISEINIYFSFKTILMSNNIV